MKFWRPGNVAFATTGLSWEEIMIGWFGALVDANADLHRL
jgi:hypothetical protein